MALSIAIASRTYPCSRPRKSASARPRAASQLSAAVAAIKEKGVLSGQRIERKRFAQASAVVAVVGKAVAAGKILVVR
jgi:hypothetical protein